MAILTEEDRLSYRIAFTVVVVGLLAVPFPPVRLVAALVILCYLPAAPFAARTGGSFLSSVAIAVTVSPLMIVLPVTIVMLLGLPLQTAVWAIVGITMAQFIVYGTQRALVAAPDERRLLLALAAIVAVAAFLALWLPGTNEWWRFRLDSWFHAAVYHGIAHNGLPVTDPYFTPLRLQYMYIYHVLLLTVSALTGLGPFGAMIFTSFIALGGCVLGVNFLLGLFTRRALARVLGVVLCVFGMNGLFYLNLPVRAARAYLGEGAGAESLGRILSLSPMGHETSARFVSVAGNQFLFLERFMVGTALTLTLGLACVVLALVLRMHSGKRTWILSFLYVAALSGVLFLHVIIGPTVVAATVGTMIVVAIMARRSRTEEGRFPLWPHVVGTVIAIGVAIPYIMSVVPGEVAGRAVGVALQPRQMVGIAACILPLLIPAVWYLARGERPRVADGGLSPAGVLAVWAGLVLAGSMFVDLPTTNETKFAYPLCLALSALAAGAFDRWLAGGRRRVAAVVVYVAACTVPLNVVYFAGAFAEPSQFVVSRSESSIYTWIEKTTRDDAIFLEADDIVRIPVLAARDQYWGTELYSIDWNYPDSEMQARRALRDAIFGDNELSEELLTHAAALDRPFYIVLRNIHADEGARFKRLSAIPHLKGKYMTESIAVFRLVLSPRDTSDLP